MNGQGEQYGFASPGAALAALLERIRPVGQETIDLIDGSGRVLAAPIVADRDSPAADVSAMDGYAVRVADLSAKGLEVAGEVRIGAEPPSLPPGKTLRIVTGAPIPAGAEAVIKREDVQEEGMRIGIHRAAAIGVGSSIRRRGENLARGQEVSGPGVLIGPAVAGALAMFGVARPRVYRRVRVGILTTGDELRGPEETPSAWQLRDSNGTALRGLLALREWMDVLPARRCEDDPQRLTDAAKELLRDVDCLLLTGGVSMGHRDFIPPMLAGLGARTVFHRLPQRPGKPTLGAVLPDGRPVMGLPGNPVSVMVTARHLGIPVLERLAGLKVGSMPSLVRLDNAGDKSIDLWWHRLARTVAPGIVEAVDGMGSGDVPAAARSDGFCEVPPGQSGPGPWPFYSWT